MVRVLVVAGVVLGVSLRIAGLSRGWWVEGHGTIAEAAATSMPEDVPAFFRSAGKALAHLAGEPDRWKNPACKHLRAAEAADHFLDLEDLDGKDLPADRYKYLQLLFEMKKQPDKVGLLPYAILENYDRLSGAFYDLRQVSREGDKTDPKVKAVIEAKCLVYAGILSHLTGDLAMPLHTTIHYDGRRKEGKTEQKGIHAKIDAFPEKHGINAEELARGLKPVQVEDVRGHVLAAFKESHSHIDRCYELDKARAFEEPTDVSRAFIRDRCRAAAQLTADLWYSAWKRSATMPPHY